MAIDKVKPLKIENPATGGTQTDVYPTEVTPTQDYISIEGIAFQDNSLRLMDLSAGGEIEYMDAVQTTYRTLNSLFQNATNIPSGFTQGSVIFQGPSSLLAQDNANLFWDDTNHRLGISTASPAVALDVNGTSASKTQILRGATSGNFTESVPATVTSYGIVWPSAQGANGTTIVNDGSGNLVWGAPFPQFFFVDATGSISAPVSTDALMTSMTLTPGAGTWRLDFNTDITVATAGAAVSCSAYIAGVQQANTLRKIAPFDGGTLSATTARGIMHIMEKITTTAGQAVTIEWSTSSGTATVTNRSFMLTRIA